MKIEPSTLDELLEEFEWSVIDFESTLLTLECLKAYWREEELQQRYSEDTFLAARHELSAFLAQHTDDLFQLASLMKNLCLGPLQS